MKKKTYIINHMPIKQMWLEENIILIKDVQMGGSKNVKQHNEKKGFLQYIKGPKFKNWVVQKLKRLKKPSWLYKVEPLNHIIIYNIVFNLVRSCYICIPCCMTTSV
jgi:hypothetical protein